jgi:hypothetical protein
MSLVYFSEEIFHESYYSGDPALKKNQGDYPLQQVKSCQKALGLTRQQLYVRTRRCGLE